MNSLDTITAATVLFFGYLLSYLVQNKESSFFEWRSGQYTAGADIVDTMEVEYTLGPEIQGQLVRLIESEKVLLQPDCSLSSLAQLLRVPEYRLRRFINRSLGFKNFNQYLNHYRILEAKRILCSEDGGQIPVYNLAMDLGYGSISSFHRVFKEATGQTPVEFRDKSRQVDKSKSIRNNPM